MTGTEQMQARRWSARQRLVVLTFDTPKDADAFDRGGLAPADVLGVVDRVADAGLLDLMHACRDVIDVWDHGRRRVADVADAVNVMRRALFELRQTAIEGNTT